MKRLAVLIFLISSFSFSQQNKSFELKAEWEFRNTDSSSWYPATVPGNVFTDLQANEIIDDPFYENNEEKYRWVEEKNWEYRTSFELSEEDLKYKHIEIEFKGVDTYSEIFLNGKTILMTDNQFLSWKTDIKEFLRKGKNDLMVSFISPLSYHAEDLENQSYELPSGNEEVEKKVSCFSRKAAYQFGWDFAPRFVGCGIWRPIQINCWNDVRLGTSGIQTDYADPLTAYLGFRVKVEGNTSNDNRRFHWVFKGLSNYVDLNDEEKEYGWKYLVNKPKLWYPNGYGKPHLYHDTLYLYDKETLIEKRPIHYGIRTIELVQEKDSIGTSFYFKVNDVPVFAKGANYVPMDMFPSRVRKMDYDWVTGRAQEMNMNMLRVWGGGIYEDDVFYQLCDEKGILVWQDFMFANSMYPSSDTLRSSIRHEARYQVERLRNHPSIALWCGNNEIEVAWSNWGWQDKFNYSDNDSTEIWKNYVQIFHEDLPAIISDLDSSRTYVSTSPLSNWGTAENFNHSSMHYWGVWHGEERIEEFENNDGRFMVEYGYPSYPSTETMSHYLQVESMFAGTTEWERRQKSYKGNRIITDDILRYYPPKVDSMNYSEESQKVQDRALRIAIESHRKAAPHCMGTLMWQLNDCWPGPSWSILDYEHRQKKAVETIKNLYSPIIAVVDTTNQNFEVQVITDVPRKFYGLLFIEIYKDGKLKKEPHTEVIELIQFEKGIFYSTSLAKLKEEFGSGELEVKLTIWDSYRKIKHFEDSRLFSL